MPDKELKKELVTVFKKSKPDKPVAFGFCMGKSPETTVMKVDDKKLNAKKLGEEAKKGSDGNKVSFGKCHLEKGALKLQFEKDGGSAEKKIKAYLKSLGVTYKVTT